jgi:hypothetical protein
MQIKMNAINVNMYPMLSTPSSSSSSSPSWEDRRHQFRHNKQLNRDRYYRHYHFCRTSIIILLYSSLFITTKSNTRCRAFVMSPCHSRGHMLIHKRKVFSFTNNRNRRRRMFFQSSMSNQASPDSTEEKEEEEDLHQRKNSGDDNHSGNGNEDDEISREKDDNTADKSSKQLSTVYEDLEKLEKAITLENAELKLKQSKMKEQIDFINQSKRPIVPDALKYIIVPLIYALLLNVLLSSKVVKIRMIARSITKVMDLHFWIFVVWVPIIFNAFKGICKPRPDPIPYEIKNLDPAHASIFLSPLSTEVGGWEDPDTSCTDYVLFLSEYWTSAVNGIALIQILKTILTGINAARGLTTVVQSSYWVVLWLSCSQLLTRMGAVASLYQYPEKMYELERSSLTRPVGFFPIVMWKLVRAMLILAPLGFISDFAKVLSQLPTGSIYPLFGSIAVYMLGTWTRMEASSSKDPLKNHLLKPPKSTSKLLYRICYGVLWRKQIRLLKLGKMMQKLWTNLCSSYTPFFWKSVGIGYLANLSLLGPILHLKSISKIFQIEYTNDLPILSTEESYNQILDENPERYYNMAWRYRLRWRDPERLTISKGNLYTYLFYLYFFKGSAQEQYTTWFQDTHFRRLEEGRTIADRLKREKEEKSLGENELPDGDRDEWKSRASKFQAEKHKKEYETKNYDDPLGVAVYKGFGVGLGFNFDHQSELKKGKQPSVRRLQARAAKSAVRRHIELTEKEKQIEELNETLDPKDKDDHDRRIQRMKKKIDDEILYLGNRLIELVPVGRGDLEEFGHLNTTKFSHKSRPEARYRRISSHEYRKLEEDPLDYDEGTSIEGRILKNIARTRNSGNETNRNYEEIILSGPTNVNNTVSENEAEEKDGQEEKYTDVDFEAEDNDNIDSNISSSSSSSSSSSDDIVDDNSNKNDDNNDTNNDTDGLLDLVDC